MISLVLAESELERVPRQILNHPSVRMLAKQKKKPAETLILDASLHHSAMTSLTEGRRRGRPDIAHIFLLCTLESIANKENLIKNIIIHTRNDDAISIDPETRIMRNYPRFIGLMEQLFEKKMIKAGKKTLLNLNQQTNLSTIIKDLNADYVIVCSETAKKTDMKEYFATLQQKKPDHIVCIIGGFPSGSFHSNIEALNDDIICLHQEKLTAWTTVNEILTWYYHTFKK
jgi:rRNA small subunit pseudouridine methyltransferase Nep1